MGAILPGSGIQYGSAQGGSSSLASAADFFTGAVNTVSQPVDPLVTGYAFIKWLKMPSWVTQKFPGFAELTEKNFKAFQGLDDIEISGIGVQAGFTNSETQFAGGISKNDGFSLTHNEFSGSPIARGYGFWASGIRDPETGVANYPKDFSLEYAARNHTGELMYIVTRPDANNKDNAHIIEFAAYYTNVMPTKIPLGHFNFTAGNQESPQIEMPFFAQRHVGEKVDLLAKTVIKNTYNFMTANDFKTSKFG